MKSNTVILILLLLTSACSPTNVRDRLGLSKSAPDEFAVVKRAPLEVSPEILNGNIALPEPKIGTSRPQEKRPELVAQETLLGKTTKENNENSLSNADKFFLQKTGVDTTQKDIRTTINQETEGLYDRNKPVVERLFGFRGSVHTPSATVVNSNEEAQRIRNNRANGKSIIDGETPSIEE